MNTKIQTKVAEHSTERLLDCLALMNRSEKAGNRRNIDEQAVFSAMCTEVERRLNLDDAIDEIFAQDADRDATYVDLIFQAIKVVA